MKGRARKWVALSTALSLMAGSTSAAAYGNDVHQRLLDLAWQSMRAGVAYDVSGQVWPGGVPAGLAVPDLTDPGDCTLPATDARNLCGEQLTVQQWREYLVRVRDARPRLSALPDGVTRGDCNFGSATAKIGDFAHAITPSYQNPRHPPSCEVHEDWKPPGVFDKFGAPDDGQGKQGLVLGWHAQMRDNDSADLSIDMLPAIPLPFPPYVLPLGQILQGASVVVELLLAAIFVPFACAWSLLSSGSNCLDDAQRLADDVDPVDVLKGVLPGIRNDEASSEVGLWHFINVRSGNSNWYDDRQGMYYDEAGPEGSPGGLDQSIMLLSDLMFMTLDASNSAGTERYEITDDETDFPNPSSDRWDWEWQSEPFAHIQYSPVDNFALYGHQRFVDNHDTTGLGWVLHAIGDVTVPQHVAGTTAWGHRPMEVAVDQALEQLLFTTCVTGSGTPTLEAAELCSNAPSSDVLMAAQLRQAHRILQRAFRWDRFAATHADPRDLITALATETYQTETSGGDLWCDACSAGYLAQDDSGFSADLKSAVTSWYTEEETEAAFDDPVGYYTGKLSRTAKLRVNLERAAAASIGYLLNAPAEAGACGVPGSGFDSECSSNASCCGESTCNLPSNGNAGRCCRSVGVTCNSDDECCFAGCGADQQCCLGAGRAGIGDSCTEASDCCSNLCEAGACIGGEGWSCRTDEQCSSGDCEAGRCTEQNSPTGTPCTAGDECAAGVCHEGTCGKRNGATCSSSSECQSGTCEGGRCGKDNGSSCGAASECAVSICDGGVCGRGTGSNCELGLECASTVCADGTCCQTNGGSCTQGADCCSLRCGTDNLCERQPVIH